MEVHYNFHQSHDQQKMSTPNPRRQSFSEGILPKPFTVKQTTKLLGYVPSYLIKRDTDKMIHAHNQRLITLNIAKHNASLKQRKKATNKVKWADKALGEPSFQPLPRRHGRSIWWSES
jgi:hypothetical protein